VELESAAMESKSFSLASLKQVILQVIVTPSYRNLLVQLPIREELFSEFPHTKRFSNIHLDMQVTSICTSYEHFFIGDIAFSGGGHSRSGGKNLQIIHEKSTSHG
jgi:hypothetical protein